MSEVFADAFYYIAILHQRDRCHRPAVAYSRECQSRIVTTQWVLTEVAAAFAGTKMRLQAERLVRRALDDTEGVVVTDFAPWFEQGLTLYAERPDKEWSLTDCISFCVMEARGIREALTGNHHFRQAGFVTLLDASAGG